MVKKADFAINISSFALDALRSDSEDPDEDQNYSQKKMRKKMRGNLVAFVDEKPYTAR